MYGAGRFEENDRGEPIGVLPVLPPLTGAMHGEVSSELLFVGGVVSAAMPTPAPALQ